MTLSAIQIAIATDSNFAMQAGVLLASIALAHPNDKVSVSVLGDGLKDGEKRDLELSAGRSVSLEFFDISDFLTNADLVELRLPQRLTNASVARLALAYILPEQERVIYLDADTLVLQSLRHLWELDLGTASTGAVRDGSFPWMATGVDWRRFDVRPDSSYFNSGVLVVSLSKWRASDMKNRALKMLRENDFRFGDQCALNILLQSEWVPIPPKWNVQSAHLGGEKALVWASEGSSRVDDARSSPAVVHFHSPWENRPWEGSSANPFASRWIEVLDETPWKGWRPKPRSREGAFLRRAKSFVRRSAVNRGW